MVASGTPPVFETGSSFQVIHHRALNSRAGWTRAVEAARAYPQYRHVAEGDLCWHFDRFSRLLYLHHPARVTDRLRPEQITSRRRSGDLLLLQDVLDTAPPELTFVFELKIGIGDFTDFAPRLVEMLEASLPGRYWIDAFSLNQLMVIKQVNRRAPTSLHTRLILGPFLLRSSPERRPLSVHRVDGLPDVDVFTIPYRYLSAQMLRARTGDRSLPAMLSLPERPLVFGSIRTPEAFRLAVRAGAIGAYAQFPLSALDTP